MTMSDNALQIKAASLTKKLNKIFKNLNIATTIRSFRIEQEG